MLEVTMTYGLTNKSFHILNQFTGAEIPKAEYYGCHNPIKADCHIICLFRAPTRPPPVLKQTSTLDFNIKTPLRLSEDIKKQLNEDQAFQCSSMTDFIKKEDENKE